MTKKKVEVGIEGQYGPRVRWIFRKLRRADLVPLRESRENQWPGFPGMSGV